MFLHFINRKAGSLMVGGEVAEFLRTPRLSAGCGKTDLHCFLSSSASLRRLHTAQSVADKPQAMK